MLAMNTEIIREIKGNRRAEVSETLQRDLYVYMYVAVHHTNILYAIVVNMAFMLKENKIK